MFLDLMARACARLPAQCAVCRAWPAQPVCEACVVRFAQPVPRCPTCALPVPAPARPCGECLTAPPPLDACLAAVSYAYPWPDCVARFKFEGQPGWARTLATVLRSAPWVEPALEQADLVLPMPLAPARLRQRGFNQALELARQLAPDRTDATLLLRLRDTQPQTALQRGERRRNVRGAFAADPLQAARLRGRRVVLVDDVMTSGASLFEAALALRGAGAAHLTGLVLARTG